MKNLLNKLSHWIAAVFQKRVRYSVDEQRVILTQVNHISEEIMQWSGAEERTAISLGQNCNASWYLKDAGLKKASYPFDWIFTTPEIISHILEDDFKTLLDKELLFPLGIDAGHKFYHASLFGHRNPASSEADYQFMERCIARWKELMHAQQPVVFLTVVLNEPEKRKRFKRGFTGQFNMPIDQKLEDFEPEMQLIKSINPNCKFLFIEQYTEGDFKLEVLHQSEDSLWLTYACKGTNTGVKYLNNFEDGVMKTLLTGLSSGKA